jgi:hypothetical protein
LRIPAHPLHQAEQSGAADTGMVKMASGEFSTMAMTE